MPSLNKPALRLFLLPVLLPVLLLAAPPAFAQNGVQDGPALLGESFSIGAHSYTPVDTPRYDEVGYAALLATAAGASTANGERYDPAFISGAHKTLPLPCYVEVTALDTGKTIIVRLNERGPMVADRLIALSPAAAEQLGLAPNGPSPVRVRRVNPSEQERALLRTGRKAAERLPPPKPLLAVLHSKLPPLASESPPPVTPAPPVPAPKSRPPLDIALPVVPEAIASSDTGVATPVTAVAKRAPAGQGGTGRFVQIGAFSSRARAEAVAGQAHGQLSQHGPLWRVRTGPYANDKAARAGLEKAQSAGFNAAKIVLND